MFPIRSLLISCLLCFTPVALSAQGANVAFGTIKADPGLPVEVTAETLDVSQEDGTALFKGDVRVAQGEMRMNAQQVLVIYNEDNSGIERLRATGDVLLVSGPDAAQADQADYTIGSGVIVMTGDVLLTQGANALTSNKMTVNLQSGTAQMVGRVKTILVPDGQN